jgi:hypothetical protein
VRKSAGLRDLYFSYAKECQDKGKEPKFSFAQFKEYCTIYLSLMTREMADNATAFKLPYGMGDVLVTKFSKPRYYKPRFVNGQATPFQNGHSAGEVCKVSWVKEDVRSDYVRPWRHKSCTYLRQAMAVAVFTKNAMTKYHQVDRQAEGLTKKERVKDRQKLDHGLDALPKEKKLKIIKDSKITRTWE